MSTMLSSGYVLTFDMVFTPKAPIPIGISNDYLWQWLLHILNFLIPGQVIEKIIIFSILFLCGIGMHRLIETKPEWPRYFAGIFYTINPFTYERWMSGEYLVLAGYALLPFLVKSLLTFCMNPGKRSALRVCLWYTALAILSIHNLVLGAILGVVIFLVHLLAQSPKDNYYRRMWRSAGLIVGGVIVLNAYWLIGIITGKSPISQTISGITNRDLSAFTTAANPHTGLFFNMLSMYGFWLERYHRYAMPNKSLFIWFGGFGLLAALILLGIREQRRARSLLAMSLGICGLLGLVVALGVQAPVTGPLVKWGITHLPLMRGFREPEKFSALLVLAYAYFAAHGLDWLLQKIPAKAEITLEIVRDAALLLPLLYVTTMLFGFAGQLKPVEYPASWYSFNKQLEKYPPTGKLLFLPWHEYMSYSFTSRIIANPAPDFFAPASVIAGTDAQYGGVEDPDPTPTSIFIENKFMSDESSMTLGATLNTAHVQYVLLSDGYNYQQYGFLGRQKDLVLVSRQSGLTVYRNEAYKK